MITAKKVGKAWRLVDGQGRLHSAPIKDHARASAQARTLSRKLQRVSTTIVPRAVIDEIHGLCKWDAKADVTDVAEYGKRFRETELTTDITIFSQALDEEYGRGTSDTFLGIMEEVQGILEKHGIRPVQDVGWRRMCELTALCCGEV